MHVPRTRTDPFVRPKFSINRLTRMAWNKWHTSAYSLCWWRQYIGRRSTCYKEKHKALVVARREIRLGENADKIKYISRDQNAGRRHSIKIDNTSFERVDHLKYLGTTLTIKIPFWKLLRADWIRKCLLSFGTGSFVFQCSIQKYED
jgi:hypothetical protein